LDLLLDILRAEAVDALLVAGDVFDLSTPGVRAQEMYYQFLCRAAGSACRHVVVIAGNHDSPSFLEAPKDLVRGLHIHVLGAVSDLPEEEILLLRDAAGRPECLVCAVPFLRDRDIRTVEAGESPADKERKLVLGIREHYARLAALARERRAATGNPEIPVVAMGHLFAAGGATVEGDGVRDLYVGGLAHVEAAIFPEVFDYVALGHLHLPQRVGGSDRIRYSGSPLPMGFGDGGGGKSLCLVSFTGREAAVRTLPLPVFRRLESIRGCWEAIAARLAVLAAEDSGVWLDVTYDGGELLPDLRDRLDEAVRGTRLEILRARNTRLMARALSRTGDEESLDSISVREVFERCLAARRVPEEQKADLRRAHEEILAGLQTCEAE
jgi:exonuclease SbcD